ncbi:MAG TPA: pilus assembly protein PilY [Geobacteraceae bacterium]
MNQSFIRTLSSVLFFMVLVLPVSGFADPGNNYCVKPPFISAARTPNLLMIIDNSASMYDMGYVAGSTSTPPSYTCSTSGGPVTVTSSYCFDNTYSDSTDYEGYFSRFDAATNTLVYPVYQYSGGKFVEVASVPTSGGTYRTGYLYLEMTGNNTLSPSTRVVSTFIASGRFLNWLTSSKFDIEKKILTGGKYDPVAQLLSGESRGCDGRRFIKVLPSTSGITGLTFAVRGPTAVEPNYDPSTQGGGTRVEVYEATYNQSDCQCAVYNWTAGNYGQASTNTANCLGTTPTDNALATLNHSQQTCWLIKDNIRKGATTDAAIWQGVNIQDIKQACNNVYTDNKNPIPPSAITNESSGNYICTSAVTNHISPVPPPYDVDGSDSSGYVGQCWKGSGASEKFTGNDDCVKREILHYCLGVNFSDVTDPSSGSSTAGSGNIPAVLMDAGVRAVGNPIGPSGGSGKCSLNTATSCSTDSGCLKVCSNDATRTCTSSADCTSPGVCLPQTCNNPFYVKAVTSVVPSGLIQDFSSSIRFGAMNFNYAGSASECGGTSGIACPKFCGGVTTGKACSSSSDCSGGLSCSAVTNLDGGWIQSNAFIGDTVGNHSSGLINSIDNVSATSWTPFAEAYYNAIAYFVKDATATNPSLDSTKFTPTANAIAAPLSGTDSYTNMNPIQYRCQLNNILMITDGASTADRNSTMVTKVTDASNMFRDPGTTAETGVCGNYYGSPFLHDLSYFAQHRNIFDPSKVCPAPSGSNYTCETAQTIKTYAVYTGTPSASTTDMCDSYAQMYKTAVNGGTTLKNPQNPVAFRNDLKDTLQQIAAGAASGTAASILSNSEGSGANILQAVFYPTKIFANQTSASWIGEMQNLWYYVDPYIQNSTIREDTNGDLKLGLLSDNVARFTFDTTTDKTMVQLYQDTNGDGTGDAAIGGLIDPDYVKSIWRAGKLLWQRDLSASPRTIKTTINGTTLIDFSSANATSLAPNLNVTDTVAPTLISWVKGTDQTGYRNRTVQIKDPVTNVVSSGQVWRLGDIISSTPRVQSTVRLNTYNLPSPGGYNDKTYEDYINSTSYQSRGMVYVGANDGMFHAINMGILSVRGSGNEKASLTGSDLGKEMWAFIPKNALPYLQYMADPLYDHLYSIDGRTAIFDASIGDDGSGVDYWDQTRTKDTWRAVVIGGMGLGGASRNTDSTCTEGVGGTCVKTPVSGVGYSSYFAFDVTDPNSPSLLWEFNDPALGYTTAGPAIVRVGDKSKNGHWFAVFGSGPTGPIDTGSHQFLGTSDQTLKFYIIDLKSGTLVRTIDTGIANAFIGTMLGGSIDVDRRDMTRTGNYQDDAVYAGYVKKVSSGTTWTDGGVLRILTKESTDPANWVVSKVIDGVGPVTTGIARSQDTKNMNLWLYFGTGRFYYRYVNSLDDNSTVRSLFGIKDPCYNKGSIGNVLDSTCTDTVSAGSLVASSGTTTASDIGTAPGWVINLDAATTTEGAERVVTDTVALTNGVVYYTSFKPTTDLCGYGGNSYLWAVNYASGGQAATNALKGKALIQLSTGEFKEVDLSTAFTDKGGRRMLTPMTGKPPSDAPPIISNSQNRPVKKILHIQEH